VETRRPRPLRHAKIGDDRQAKTRPSVTAGRATVALPEWLEDLFPLLGWYPGTTVMDLDPNRFVAMGALDLRTGGGAQNAADPAAFGRELHRVAQQIEEDPPNLFGIDLHRQAFGGFDGESKRLGFRRGLEMRGCEAQEAGEVGSLIADLHLTRLQPCDVQQVIDVLQEHAGERELSAPATYEHCQRHSDGHIGQADQRIGDHVQPDQPRLPQVAVPVRVVPFGGE
jgi:hypothetical protein